MKALPTHEPQLSVGLVSDVKAIRLRLLGEFALGGRQVPPGDYDATQSAGVVALTEATSGGASVARGSELHLMPPADRESRFEIEATIGIGFHWEQNEQQIFCGHVKLCATHGDRVSIINEVPLETYLRSVVCSEMSAGSPIELLRAHAIVSRSWLLAQLSGDKRAGPIGNRPGERIRIYDHESHADFDVCADDHCQRYQGVGRIVSAPVSAAIDDTRGIVLVHDAEVCDARFSKCCGGVTEAFGASWQDREVSYLSPIRDAADRTMPATSLVGESAFGRYLATPLPSFCDCSDTDLLGTLLPKSDMETRFYRWRERREAGELTRLLGEKAGIDIGRVTRLEPIERGASGRLVRLRIVGDRGEIVVGKELEIRRLLSPTHLRSSAFVTETIGNQRRPDVFIFHGAGWGHGVGLCQIGAAVMAIRGYEHLEIMQHYYRDAGVVRAYL